MANYKDQGVKNHEIERLTPQLLKFFSLYDQWLLLFREVSSTHTYKHIQATAHQLFSFFSYIISLSYSPFILMTDHFLFLCMCACAFVCGWASVIVVGRDKWYLSLKKLEMDGETDFRGFEKIQNR